MIDGISQGVLKPTVRDSRGVVGREGVLVLGLLLEFMLISFVALATGVVYHALVYGEVGPVGQYVGMGLLLAILFEMPLIARSHYRSENELAGARGVARIVNAWTYAFVFITVIGFLTKTSDQVSRGWLILFYVSGLVSLLIFELAMRRGLRAAARAGLVSARRLVVVGTRQDVERFEQRSVAPASGVAVVAVAFLPGNMSSGGSLDRDTLVQLNGAVERARKQRATDVVILGEGPHGSDVTSIADLFLDLPVAVHLGQSGLVEHFPRLRATQLGAANTLVLRNEPLSAVQVLAKRVLDVVASTLALLLLSPLLVVVALLIKLDSQGPVFFRQRRRGFNLQEFQIWKFRTMTTMEDGDTIIQAQRNDARVTRIGKLLRRYNIDELPQLINVITGSMSLVGPRPHAVAHDRQYEQTIARYARRLNVRPGITGWAQIHGCRGATETDAAMQARVAHDLYYIENWSLALDVYILAMTVLSPKAYRNAH